MSKVQGNILQNFKQTMEDQMKSNSRERKIISSQKENIVRNCQGRHVPNTREVQACAISMQTIHELYYNTSEITTQFRGQCRTNHNALERSNKIHTYIQNTFR